MKSIHDWTRSGLLMIGLAFGFQFRSCYDALIPHAVSETWLAIGVAGFVVAGFCLVHPPSFQQLGKRG